jgi:hypothetical protein
MLIRRALSLLEFPEAAQAYDDAAVVSATPMPARFRARRALFWACAGEHQKAAAEAEAIAITKPPPTIQIQLAEVWARASATAQIEPDFAEKYAQHAVAAIQDAIARGYRDLGKLKTSPHLESLQSRADFQPFSRRKSLAELQRAQQSPRAKRFFDCERIARMVCAVCRLLHRLHRQRSATIH